MRKEFTCIEKEDCIVFEGEHTQDNLTIHKDLWLAILKKAKEDLKEDSNGN